MDKKKKFGQMYDEVLNEWMSSYMKAGAVKTGAISGAVIGLAASTIPGVSMPYVSLAAAAAYLLGYGHVWLADKLVSRDLKQKEVDLKLRMSIDHMKNHPAFARQAQELAHSPEFKARMAKKAAKLKVVKK